MAIPGLMTGKVSPGYICLQGNSSTSLFTICFGIASLNLSGKIPYEIGKMQYLRYLDLHSNEISGPLPNELGDVGLLSKSSSPIDY
eukprot:scaffold6597_cov123-Chaetoceros_neogracile.AAC.1